MPLWKKMARPGLRGKIAAALAAVLILVFAYYFRRDLNVTRAVDWKNLPDVIVESLAFERTIEGKSWDIKATRAEHIQGVIRANDLDIEVKELSSGRASHITAQSGEFTRESANLSLVSVDGLLSLKDRSVDWRAPSAAYDSSMDLWTFGRGIKAQDGTLIVSGDFATISSAGIFQIEKGAEARWNAKE